jgi:hypothetical protein
MQEKYDAQRGSLPQSRAGPRDHIQPSGMAPEHSSDRKAQIAIGSLVQRLPKLALATDKPDHRLSLTLRGLQTLPVSPRYTTLLSRQAPFTCRLQTRIRQGRSMRSLEKRPVMSDTVETPQPLTPPADTPRRRFFKRAAIASEPSRSFTP